MTACELLQIKLMYREASDRLNDAEILCRNIRTRGSSILLELLAFELLLKCLVLIHNGVFKRAHNYEELFFCLPVKVQKRVLCAAESRTAGNANYSDIRGLLQTFSKNFVDLRYPYERYKDLNENELKERAERWLAMGAKVEEADFVFYPVELYGLNHAISSEVELCIANK